jgi:hypothetical protein
LPLLLIFSPSISFHPVQTLLMRLSIDYFTLSYWPIENEYIETYSFTWLAFQPTNHSVLCVIEIKYMRCLPSWRIYRDKRGHEKHWRSCCFEIHKVGLDQPLGGRCIQFSGCMNSSKNNLCFLWWTCNPRSYGQQHKTSSTHEIW